ncbi:hypothetical protein CU098_001286, partial [Rhizopus stolonifer]
AEPATTSAPAATPAVSEVSAPAASAGTAAPTDSSSLLVTGTQLESVIENMLAMGFERTECERALRASFNNPDRAVEYLVNGIPQEILNEMNVSERQPEGQSNTAAQNPTPAPAPTAAPTNDTNASMNLFTAAQQQQQQQQQQEQGQNMNMDLSNFRNTPHFQQIRQLVQTNPALLQPLLQSIGESNPELIRAINADPNAFLQAFMEGGDMEEGPEGTTTIQVTPEERDAIDRLAALGFDKTVAAEAYFACDKNEELAANYLQENLVMDQQAVEIKSKKVTAPTPQNTPINAAPINSQSAPSVPPISEENETISTSGFKDSNNPALLSMLQGKLGNLVNEPLPAVVQRRINGLKYLQSKHSELEGEFQKEVLALEKKYLELYRPLYNKRAEVISGQYEPSEKEVAAGAKGVPQFWLTALKTHPQIGDIITDEDTL